MKRFVLYVGIALFAFASGVIAEKLWKSHSTRSTAATVQNVEEEWPLTKQIVSRSLQSHSFRTERLRRNSNEEVVWRWLKESIANFPQNWVKLNISDSETYGVVLYPLRVLEASELDYYNKELEKKRLVRAGEGKALSANRGFSGNHYLSQLVRADRCRRSQAGLFSGTSG